MCNYGKIFIFFTNAKGVTGFESLWLVFGTFGGKLEPGGPPTENASSKMAKATRDPRAWHQLLGLGMLLSTSCLLSEVSSGIWPFILVQTARIEFELVEIWTIHCWIKIHAVDFRDKWPLGTAAIIGYPGQLRASHLDWCWVLELTTRQILQ